MTTTKSRFICSYQGESDYEWNGKRYHCRWTESPPSSTGDTGRRSVGTVRPFCGDTLPPEELMAHFPGYVPAGYLPDGTGDTHTFETTAGDIEVLNRSWQCPDPPHTVEIDGKLWAAAHHHAIGLRELDHSV